MLKYLRKSNKIVKKKKNLKLDNILKYWHYLCLLRSSGVLIFCQNMSLDALKDLNTYQYFTQNNNVLNHIIKKLGNKLISSNFLKHKKYFNDIIILKNILELNEVEKYLKKNNILILGYYYQNIFFYKNDLNVKKQDKKNICQNLKERFNIFFSLNRKILMNLKNSIIKFILLLKKKQENGNY